MKVKGQVIQLHRLAAGQTGDFTGARDRSQVVDSQEVSRLKTHDLANLSPNPDQNELKSFLQLLHIMSKAHILCYNGQETQPTQHLSKSDSKKQMAL